MPTIDVDSQTAHDAAAGELAKPVYPKPSFTDRIAEWVNEMLHRLMNAGAALPGGWLTLVVLALLVLAGVLVAVRVARRAMGRRGDGRLYGSRTRTAADHRAEAEQSAARGDWSGAIRHRVRAIGRELEEDRVLNPVPGRTAGELAREAGAALPDCASDFDAAAGLFNEVTYGGQPGSEAGYRLVSDLDDRLSRVAPGAGAGAPPS